MAEYEVKHRRINNFKLIGWILTLLHIKAFIAIEKWYGVNEVNSKEVFIYRKRLGRMYDSYANFRDLDEPDEPPAADADGGKGDPSAAVSGGSEIAPDAVNVTE